MDIKKLQRTIVDALEDVKAQDIAVFNTTGLTTLFDRVVLATASSNRQTRALASRVGEKVKAAGGHVISTEGLDTGEWVLVDLGDAVVHIMQPAIRAYYKLEEIWGGKPVRMVLGGARPIRTDAEPQPEVEAEPEPETPAPAARKPAARKTAAKTPARSGAKPAVRSAAKPASKSARTAKSAKSAKSAGSAAPRRAPAKKATKSAGAAPRARKTAAKRAG